MSGAVKKDADKNPLELVSDAALFGLGAGLCFGKEKYDEDNWREGFEWRRLIGAARRHLTLFSAGEDRDPESGLPHLDHLMCTVMFLSEHQKRGLGQDDRVKLDPLLLRRLADDLEEAASRGREAKRRRESRTS